MKIPSSLIKLIAARARHFGIDPDRVRFDRARVVQRALEIRVDGILDFGVAMALAQAAFASGYRVAIAFISTQGSKRVLGENLWQPTVGAAA